MSGTLEKKPPTAPLTRASEYRKWKKLMKLHFVRNGRWKIVDGSDRDATDEKKASVFCDILSCIKGELRNLVLEYDDPSEAWSALEKICYVSDEDELLNAQQELENLRLEKSLVDTVFKMKAILARIKRFHGLVSDNQIVLKLFSLLPKSFKELVLRIKLDKAFKDALGMYDSAKVIEAVLNRATVDKSIEPVKEPEKKGESVLQVKCNNCGQNGHKKSKCKKCWHCKQDGHKSWKCPEKKNSEKESVKISVMMAKTDSLERTSSFEVCIDSGASIHCCGNKTLMSNVVKRKTPLEIEGLKGTIKSHFVGEIMGILDNGEGFKITDVAFVPNLSEDVIVSMSQLDKKGWKLVITGQKMEMLKPNDDLFAIARMGKGNLYWLNAEKYTGKMLLASNSDRESVQHWHEKLGHVSFNGLKDMIKNGSVRDLPSLDIPNDMFCVACGVAKLPSRKVSKQTIDEKIIAKQELKKIHCDTIGNFPHGGHEKFQFALIIVDDLTKYKWSYCVQSKDQIPSVLVTKRTNFVTPYEVFWGKKPTVKHLVRFGATGVAIDERPRKALANEGREVMFLGYDTSSRTYG